MDTSFGAYNFFGIADLVYIYPANIRLDEDVFIKTNIFAVVIRLQDVFKKSSRRIQDVLKTSSRSLQDVLKTSSRRLQDIFKTF